MTQINAVANPIINSPYQAPQHYWLIREGMQPEKKGGRRPASYFFRVPERAARGRKSGEPQVVMFEDAARGQEYLLDTANLLRQRVTEWREKRDYEGATRVTRELLELWNSPDRREPMFYAQNEAAETLIFLIEGPIDLKQGVHIPLDEPGTEAKAAGFGANVPPVFIIVCRNTALAKILYEWLAHGEGAFGQGVPEFRNHLGEERTVRIDSRVAEDMAGGGSEDEARRLRFLLETIGKTNWPADRIPEDYATLIEKHNCKALEDDESELIQVNPSIPPGRDIRCIISVAMLSEGWDATTVTHVVGLRPFGSQLLCEQVVGRALRRTSYMVDPDTKFFREETAKVFGVPFELIPFKVEGGFEQPPTPPANHIFAVPEKVRYEITVPLVEAYVDPGITRLAVDWERVRKIVLDPAAIPDATLVRGLATQDGALNAYGPGSPVLVSLDAWRQGVRVQQVAFALARELTVAWVRDRGGDGVPTHVLFPQLLNTVNRFLAEKVECKGNRAIQDVAVNPYFGQALGALLDAITAVDESGQSSEKPIIAGMRSTKWVDFHTGKDIAPVHRCHLNAGVFDTKKSEQQAAFVLDTHERVDRWVKNERMGFFIPYRREGILRRYFPDFIVELTDGDKLIVETKGQDQGDVGIKTLAARRWCQAVNNDGRYGHWSYYLVWEASALSGVLAKHPALRAAG